MSYTSTAAEYLHAHGVYTEVADQRTQRIVGVASANVTPTARRGKEILLRRGKHEWLIQVERNGEAHTVHRTDSLEASAVTVRMMLELESSSELDGLIDALLVIKHGRLFAELSADPLSIAGGKRLTRVFDRWAVQQPFRIVQREQRWYFRDVMPQLAIEIAFDTATEAAHFACGYFAKRYREIADDSISVKAVCLKLNLMNIYATSLSDIVTHLEQSMWEKSL